MNVEVNTLRGIKKLRLSGKYSNIGDMEQRVIHLDYDENEEFFEKFWNSMNFFCTKNHCDVWINNMDISDKDIIPVDIRTDLLVGKAVLNEKS